MKNRKHSATNKPAAATVLGSKPGTETRKRVKSASRTTGTVAGRKRHQQRRAAESRKRLLDAAAASLCKRGFTGATVVEIARRARLSLGCLQHHFPEKSDLLVASVEHVFELHRSRLVNELAGLPDTPERVMRGLDLLWEIMQGDVFIAYLELVVAARTDRALQRHVERTERRLVEACKAAFGTVYSPPAVAVPFADIMPSLVINLLEGAMLSKIASPRENNAEQVVAAIKAIHALATGGAVPGAKAARSRLARAGGRKRSP